MNVHPLIPTGGSAGVSFDPTVLYQFKIDNTGDAKEDLVIQARFQGTGPTQHVIISGPVAPDLVGTQSHAQAPDAVVGQIERGEAAQRGGDGLGALGADVVAPQVE